MEAWQKREMEQREFLEKLHHKLVHDAEGEYRDDNDILGIVRDLLNATLYEQNPENSPRNETWRAINQFARTEAEGMILKHKLLVMLLESGFHDADSEYLRQQVHEQGKLYEGRRAMDEVE